MPEKSDFGFGLLVYAACCGVAAFVGWPLIKGALPGSFPLEHPYEAAGPRAAGMRLDPDVTPGQVEDRTSGSGQPTGGTWPRSRAGAGMPREDDREDPGPGDGERDAPSGRRPGGIRCRDTQTGRDVSMSFCDREDRERAGRRR